MTLLDNELVQRYFGCTGKDDYERASATAFLILQAMQEPIKKGDKYLRIDEINGVYEMVLDRDFNFPSFHPFNLRLPDRFQKQGCDCKCHSVHAGLCKCGVQGPTPDGPFNFNLRAETLEN